MMRMLKKSTMLRWTAVWLLTSVLLTAVLQLISYLRNVTSTFGETLTAQFIFILVLSLPWFLGGEILSRLVLGWKKDSRLQKLGSFVLLLVATALILTSLIFVGIIEFYFS